MAFGAFSEKLRLIIDADAKGAIKEIEGVGKSADRELGRAEQKARNWSATFNRAGATLVTGAAVASVGLWKLGQAASELEQQVGGTKAVFGQSASAIDAWAKTAAKSAGLSEAAARQATSQIGALLQGLGMNSKEAAGEAMKLTQLGSDLAATFGGSVQEAITAVSAALRGERDPIERYGVSFKQTDVNARAAAMGLDQSTAAAQKNATRMATLSILYEQTAGAQGQFAREAETAAGRQAILAAEFENAKTAIGQGVLPVMSELIGLVGNVTSAFNSLDPELQKGIGSLATFATLGAGASGGLLLVVGQAIQLKQRFDELAVSAPKAAAAIKGVGVAGVAVGAFVATVEGLIWVQEALTNANENAAKSFDRLAKSTRNPEKAYRDFGAAVEDANDASQAMQLEMLDFVFPVRYAAKQFQVLTGRVDETNDTFRKLARESPAAAQAVIDGMAKAGKETDQFKTMLREALVEQAKHAIAQEESAKKVQALTDAMRAGKQITNESADAIARETLANKEAAATQDELRKKIEGKMNAQIASIDSTRGAEQAQRDVNEAALEYLDAQDKVNKGEVEGLEATGKLEDAKRKLLDAIVTQAGAAQRLAEDQAKSNGITDTAALGAYTYRKKLEELRDQFPELRDEIDKYIALLKDVPTEIRSVVFLDTTDAKQKVTELEQKWLGFRALSSGSGSTSGTFWGSAETRASGGPVAAGNRYWVGERGPEPFIPTTGGRIISNDRAGNYAGETTVIVTLDGRELAAHYETIVGEHDRAAAARASVGVL